MYYQNTIKDYKNNFISGANTYMFRHQGAIIRELINNNNKSLYVQQVFQALFAATCIIKVKH